MSTRILNVVWDVIKNNEIEKVVSKKRDRGMGSGYVKVLNMAIHWACVRGRLEIVEYLLNEPSANTKFPFLFESTTSEIC